MDSDVVEPEPWQQLWRIEGGDDERDSLLATLPRYTRMKNNNVSCSIENSTTSRCQGTI